MARLKGDATVDDILALPENASAKARKKLVQEIPGGGFAAPGQSDVALINLAKPGRYVARLLRPRREHAGCRRTAATAHRTRTKA